MLVSHDEVKHYLRSQAQTSAEESTTSESLQDTVPARGHHVSTGGVVLCVICYCLCITQVVIITVTVDVIRRWESMGMVLMNTAPLVVF